MSLYFLDLSEWSADTRVNGKLLPPNIEQTWSDAELAAVGLYKPLPAVEVPAGKYVVDTTLQIVEGVPRWVNELSDTPPPVPVPESITPLQARKALRAAGVKPLVDAYVAQLPEEAREEWEWANRVYRDNTIIAAGAAALGWTEEQIDDLFRLGATLA